MSIRVFYNREGEGDCLRLSMAGLELLKMRIMATDITSITSSSTKDMGMLMAFLMTMEDANGLR